MDSSWPAPMARFLQPGDLSGCWTIQKPAGPRFVSCAGLMVTMKQPHCSAMMGASPPTNSLSTTTPSASLPNVTQTPAPPRTNGRILRPNEPTYLSPTSCNISSALCKIVREDSFHDCALNESEAFL